MTKIKFIHPKHPDQVLTISYAKHNNPSAIKRGLLAKGLVLVGKRQK